MPDASNVDTPIVFAERYEVLQTLGSGGMGMVYRVRDRRLQRQLALKTIRPSRMLSESAISRFIEEAQISSQLQHPAIVPIHDIGRLADGRMYYTMAWVRGQTLSEALTKSPLEARRKSNLFPWLRIVRDAALAMAYAHARHVIHRDLKPSNLMLDPHDKVFVIDWGLARIVTSAVHDSHSEITASRTRITSIRQEHRDHPPTAVLDAPLVPDDWSDDASISSEHELQTARGSVIGTVAYMPPEQARGEIDQVDARSDVFSLAAILTEVISGRPPYDTSDAEQRLLMATTGDLSACHQRIAQSHAPTPIKTIATACLQADPADRPRHAGEFAQLLDQQLTVGVSRRRWLVVGGIATGAGVLSALKWPSAAGESTDEANAISNSETSRSADQIDAALEQSLLSFGPIKVPSSEAQNLSYRQILQSIGVPLDSEEAASDWIHQWPQATQQSLADAILRWKWLPPDSSRDDPPSSTLVSSAMSGLNTESQRMVYQAIAQRDYEAICESISQVTDSHSVLAGIDAILKRPPDWDINRLHRSVHWWDCAVKSVNRVHPEKASVASDGWITFPDPDAFFDEATIQFGSPISNSTLLKIEIEMDDSRTQSWTDIVRLTWEPSRYQVRPKVDLRIVDIVCSVKSPPGYQAHCALDDNRSTLWRLDHALSDGPINAILIANSDHNGSFADGGTLRIHSGEPGGLRRTTLSRIRLAISGGSAAGSFDAEAELIPIITRLANRHHQDPRMLRLLALRIASMRNADLNAATVLASNAVELDGGSDRSMNVLVGLMLHLGLQPDHPAMQQLLGRIDQVASSEQQMCYRSLLKDHWQQRATELRNARVRRGVDLLENAAEGLLIRQD